jgi:hypothetical protein
VSYKPATIVELAAYWTSQGGVNLGIVGNDRHCAGYHLGRDRIYSNCACAPGGDCRPGRYDLDYSVRKDRDKSGLSNAASALDLGRLDGSLTELYAFSIWLVERCKDRAPGTGDVREVIYSPDGTAIRRWDNLSRVLYVGGDGTGQGDNSHRAHSHISWLRDSEFRSKLVLFQPYFEREHDMVITRTAWAGGQRLINFKAGAKAAGFVVRDGKLTEAVPERLWTEDSRAWSAYDVSIDGDRAYQITSGYYAPNGSTYVFASPYIYPDPDPEPLDELAIRQAEYDRVAAAAKAAIELPPRP